MNIKIIKLTTYFAAATLLISCGNVKKTFQKEVVLQDCSSIFETRYVGFEQKNLPKITKDKVVKLTSECKVLAVKLDDNIKCEIVGSDKIDNLSKAIGENSGDKIVLVAPTKKLRDISKLLDKYLASNGVDITKYLETDLFKNLAFPYKGMKCTIADKKFVAWEGKNQVILTITDK